MCWWLNFNGKKPRSKGIKQEIFNSTALVCATCFPLNKYFRLLCSKNGLCLLVVCLPVLPSIPLFQQLLPSGPIPEWGVPTLWVLSCLVGLLGDPRDVHPRLGLGEGNS